MKKCRSQFVVVSSSLPPVCLNPIIICCCEACLVILFFSWSCPHQSKEYNPATWVATRHLAHHVVVSLLELKITALSRFKCCHLGAFPRRGALPRIYLKSLHSGSAGALPWERRCPPPYCLATEKPCRGAAAHRLAAAKEPSGSHAALLLGEDAASLKSHPLVYSSPA